VKTLEQIKTESMASNRLNAIMLGAFATVALLLSAIGIYGVISYSIVQRTHEIGIRSALGATASNVVGLVLRHGMVMAGAGVVIGFVAALALTRLIASLVFGVSARDPITIAGVGVLLALVGLLATYVPARRAAKVDPMVCLRYE
jgi:putative ABC transport system permease protein